MKRKLKKIGGIDTMANIMKRNSSTMPATTSPVMSFGGLVDSVFNNTLNRFFDEDIWRLNGLTGVNAQVPVNLRETADSFEMEVVAPGLRKEDFNVDVSDNMLTVSFDLKKEDRDERDGYIRQEYCMQSFSRSFMLDETVNADKITATYKDGVLHLSLPKNEGARKITKKIQVK